MNGRAVYVERRRGADGRDYDVLILADAEELAGYQAAGVVGEVSEVVALQQVADVMLAQLEKRMAVLTGERLQ